MKKICKFLTFLLVLAMLLSTVAMAKDIDIVNAEFIEKGKQIAF